VQLYKTTGKPIKNTAEWGKREIRRQKNPTADPIDHMKECMIRKATGKQELASKVT